MRVEPVGSRIRHDECVLERATGGDGVLRQSRYAVHIVTEREAVPVHRRLCRQFVGQSHPQFVSGPHSNRRAGHDSVVRPCSHDSPSKVDLHRSRA